MKGFRKNYRLQFSQFSRLKTSNLNAGSLPAQVARAVDRALPSPRRPDSDSGGPAGAVTEGRGAVGVVAWSGRRREGSEIYWRMFDIR